MALGRMWQSQWANVEDLTRSAINVNV